MSIILTNDMHADADAVVGVPGQPGCMASSIKNASSTAWTSGGQVSE